MNQPIHGIPPIPQTPFGTAPVASGSRIEFADGRSAFRRLVMRGALLELITLAFYRFWLATDMRRHLWSHTSVDGDAPEYVGTAKELLIGFLFALAILVPLYLVYFLIGIEAERVKAFASVPLGLFYYLFIQFAVYRARRYRLTRTVWRGVRFSMGGSGINYAFRVGLWTLLAVVTVGLALPWRQAALERYKMRHTAYGNLQGQFVGTGGGLFKRGWWLWLLVLVCVVVLAALAAVPVVGSIAPFAFWISGVFIYGLYKSIEWRWWASGLRFGDVSFESELRAGQMIGLYWKLIGWGFLIMVLLMVWIGVAYGLAMMHAGVSSTNQQAILLIAQSPVLWIGGGVGYMAFILAFWTVMRLYLIHDVWQRVATSVTVHNLALAADIAGQGQTVSALGEGFADSLDIGGL